VAELHQLRAAPVRVAVPVKIERFDNLSSWAIFQTPRLVEVVGSDHLAHMSVVLPVTCIGPLDPVVILINISPNPERLKKSAKIRVNKIGVLCFIPQEEIGRLLISYRRQSKRF